MSNDERILELRSKIEAKRKEVGKSKRFEPVTNCSLLMNGTDRFNLHTVSKEIATTLLVSLNALRMSVDDLQIEYKVSGFDVKDWIADLKARLAHLENAQERRRLDRLEAELERLLSDEKQTELAIDNIADSI